VIIDALSGSIPLPEAFGAADASLARLRGYREHFMGAERAGTYADMETSLAEAYESAAAATPSEEEFLAKIDDAAIDIAAVFTENYRTRLAFQNASNDVVAEWVAKHPDRFIGIGGIDPWQDDSAAEVDRAVRELGLKGVLLSPFKQGLEASSPRLSRVFGRCEALGVPVFVHCGVNWFAESPYDIGHPRGIDDIATGFPDLKLVAVHAGWPWVLDMMVVAWRHPNVYVDISAHRPKHFTIPEAGWGPLLHYGSRMLADRIVFGTTWTLLRTEPKELVDETRGLPVPDAVLDKWMGTNAARLFGLD
jgi:predicted TIM-barrel fold metal-dependent hydrolase